MTAPEPGVRKAEAKDLPGILSLFDAAVAWLAEQGLEGQWGTEMFSHNPDVVGRFGAWIEAGNLHVACEGDTVVGTVVLEDKPPSYARETCDGNPRQALYLEAFVTDRRLAGRRIGDTLLAWAEEEAARRGVGWLRLDCWAGNGALRGYYRRAGFEEVEKFGVGSWRGALFEKPVGAREAAV